MFRAKLVVFLVCAVLSVSKESRGDFYLSFLRQQ